MIGIFCYSVDPRKIVIEEEKSGLINLTFYQKSLSNSIRIDMSKEKFLKLLEQMEKKAKKLGMKINKEDSCGGK